MGGRQQDTQRASRNEHTTHSMCTAAAQRGAARHGPPPHATQPTHPPSHEDDALRLAGVRPQHERLQQLLQLHVHDDDVVGAGVLRYHDGGRRWCVGGRFKDVTESCKPMTFRRMGRPRWEGLRL